MISDGGMGKSHLCAALVEEAKRAHRGANVVELRAREPIEGEADANLRALLGRCFAVPAEKPADRGEALLGELGPQLWPAAALTLGWMTPEEPELRTLAAAPGVLRATVSRSVGQALRLRAQERPLAVILDDAHHADDATLDALEYATMPDTEVPLWVCVAARPSLAQMKPSWGERSAAHLRLELGPLAAEAATELARRLLFPLEHVPAAALETLVTGTHGNPFLLTELIRGLKRNGIVRPDPKTGIYFIATDELARLPDLAVTDWLAEREIGGLAPELAAHARLCALLGVDFAEDEVEGVLSELERNPATGQLDPDLRLDAHVATRQLVSMGLFKRLRGGRAAFRHSLLRAAVEKSVSDKLRTEVHAAAFRFYRAAKGLEEAVRLGRVALHAAGAGYRAEAAPVYLDLADRARARHRYVDAESLYSRALGQIDETDLRQRMIALRGRALMRYRMSRHDSVDDLAVALEVARRLADRAAEVEIIMETVDRVRVDGRIPQVDGVDHREATALADKLDVQERLVARVASRRAGTGGVAQLRSGRRGREAARGDRDGGFARGGGVRDPRDLAAAPRGSAAVPRPGRRGRAGVRHADVAVPRARQSDAPDGGAPEHAAALARASATWNARWRRRAAASEIAREIGVVVATFGGEFNVGELLYQAGEPDDARPPVQRAVEIEAQGASPVTSARRRACWRPGCSPTSVATRRPRRLVDEITAIQTEAERTGDAESLLIPSEQVLLRLVDLCTRDATDAEWTDLRGALADGVDRAGADRGRGDDRARARATRPDRSGPAQAGRGARAGREDSQRHGEAPGSRRRRCLQAGGGAAVSRAELTSLTSSARRRGAPAPRPAGPSGSTAPSARGRRRSRCRARSRAGAAATREWRRARTRRARGPVHSARPRRAFDPLRRPAVVGDAAHGRAGARAPASRRERPAPCRRESTTCGSLAGVEAQPQRPRRQPVDVGRAQRRRDRLVVLLRRARVAARARAARDRRGCRAPRRRPARAPTRRRRPSPGPSRPDRRRSTTPSSARDAGASRPARAARRDSRGRRR